MFSLNRYAKHRCCSHAHKREIYELKTALVSLLYRLGYAAEVRLQTVTPTVGQCWSCLGTGRFEIIPDAEEDFGEMVETCGKCNGTGEYRTPEHHNLRFVFQIDEQRYVWHQPTGRLAFSPRFTAPTEDYWPGEETKPVPMSPSRFAEAKALIRWVMEGLNDSRLAAEGTAKSHR